VRIIKKADLQRTGKSILLYGKAGVGKTVSILAGAPDPIAYIQIEPRSLVPSLEAANRPDLDIEIMVTDNFSDLKNFLRNTENFSRFNSVVIDSYSHLMNISLSSEIEDQTFDTFSDEEKRRKPLINEAKMSLEGYGGLASQMFRMTDMLCKLSTIGKVIIATARLVENPTWNRTLAAAPALKGKEFPANMPGFFDLIGLVTSRVDEEGKIVYPPYVQFESPDDSFVAKYTGPGNKKSGPLNLAKILSV